MAETGPIVDLAAFPIVAAHTPANEPARHSVRNDAICGAVAKALGLPTTIALDANADYATLSYCGINGGAPEVEYRARINGFSFGKGSHRATEYLSLSFVGLDATQVVVGWSEDLQAFRGTQKYWDAVNAGLPPPKPPKPNMRDCALLTFVDASGNTLPITKTIRALVAKVLAPLSAPAAPKRPAPKK